MNDLLILGTDTDAGKTTLALFWLTAFGEDYEYWKPVETGPADSGQVAKFVPACVVHPAVCWFPQAVAPPLAARMEKKEVPAAAVLAAARPGSPRYLLVETFGSPFSPLNETELQIELIQALHMPAVLVSSSKLGAIGRTLPCLMALSAHGIEIRAVVLMGEVDPFAAEKIRQHRPGLPVFSLRPPTAWTAEEICNSAAQQADVLAELRRAAACGLAPNAKPQAVVERDRQSVWHPYTPLRGSDPPLVCTGAQDEFLFLEDGRRIIDGISSWWTILHGHRYPPLMTALCQAMERFDHVHFAGVTHAPAVELAELLLESMPWRDEPGRSRLPGGTYSAGGTSSLDKTSSPNVQGPARQAGPTGRVFYSDDGSTAVEVALKMAYQFWCHQGQPGRTRFVGFEHGYHGDTFGAMAVSRDPVFFGRFEPLLLRADILPLDPDRLDEHLSKHGRETAGVVLEPLVQGAGGMRMHTPEMLRKIFEVTRGHDVLFLADEVMTGGGRTGTLWAHQPAGIAPDLVCAGKTLTGGILPLAATLVSPRVVEVFDTADRTRTFFHGHSFTAHPLACAAAAANWKLLNSPSRDRQGAIRPAEAMEAFWRTALAPLAELPQVREVRIRGSIAALEVRTEANSSGYLADVGQTMRRRCLEEGVLLRPLGNVLYALPPLATSAASLEKIAAAMTSAVQASRAP